MKGRGHLPLMLLALCAAVLVLSACGSSNDGTGSVSQTTADAEGSTGPSSEVAKAATGSKDTQTQKLKADGPGSTQRTSTKTAPGKKRNGDDREQGAPTRAPQPTHIKGCPTGATKKQCAQIGQAYEQQKGGSTEVQSDECPPTLSAGECKNAGKAYEEAQTGGQTVDPSECPSAMTAAQCAEAGKAYEEATK